MILLSHNARDKEAARALGSNLLLAGAEVWFDEWEIGAGDSIPGSINDGLESFDTFVLLWSTSAAESDWVRSETEVALMRRMEDGSIRTVPVRLDRTPLPALLRPIRRVDWLGGDVSVVVREILGFANERERLKAIQATLDDLAIEIRFFYGYGPIVACPSCGAPAEALRGWSQTDVQRDDLYAGAECTECGWQDGGEI
jgi:hypothetical protein